MRTLEATLTEIRTQNGGFVIAGCIANRWAGRQAWDWLTAHWDDVLRRLPESFHGYMLEGIGRLTDRESVREVPAFLEEHPIAAARRRIAQLLNASRSTPPSRRASGTPWRRGSPPEVRVLGRRAEHLGPPPDRWRMVLPETAVPACLAV